MAPPKKPKISSRQGAFAFDAEDATSAEASAEFADYESEDIVGGDDDDDDDELGERRGAKLAGPAGLASDALAPARAPLSAAVTGLPDDEDDELSPKERKLAEMRLEAQIEAIVFASPKPLKPAEILELLADRSVREEHVQRSLDELVDHYEQRCGGIRLHHLKRIGYQFQTLEDAGPIMERMFASRPRPISRASLETLSIIAYRQPVTRAEVEFIRGVDAGSIFKTLLERDLIKCVGRKEIVGRPMLFGTTEEFLKVFNLSSVKDLPPLESFQPSREVMQGAAERLAEGDESLVDVEQFISQNADGEELVGDVDELDADDGQASLVSDAQLEAVAAAEETGLSAATAESGSDAADALNVSEDAPLPDQADGAPTSTEAALDVADNRPHDPGAALLAEPTITTSSGASTTGAPQQAAVSALDPDLEVSTLGQESPDNPPAVSTARERTDADPEVAISAGSGLPARGGDLDH